MKNIYIYFCLFHLHLLIISLYNYVKLYDSNNTRSRQLSSHIELKMENSTTQFIYIVCDFHSISLKFDVGKWNWNTKHDILLDDIMVMYCVEKKGQCLSSYIKTYDLLRTLNDFVLQNVFCCWFILWLIKQPNICCFEQYLY